MNSTISIRIICFCPSSKRSFKEFEMCWLISKTTIHSGQFHNLWKALNYLRFVIFEREIVDRWEWTFHWYRLESHEQHFIIICFYFAVHRICQVLKVMARIDIDNKVYFLIVRWIKNDNLFFYCGGFRSFFVCLFVAPIFSQWLFVMKPWRKRERCVDNWSMMINILMNCCFFSVNSIIHRCWLIFFFDPQTHVSLSWNCPNICNFFSRFLLNRIQKIAWRKITANIITICIMFIIAISGPCVSSQSSNVPV